MYLLFFLILYFLIYLPVLWNLLQMKKCDCKYFFKKFSFQFSFLKVNKEKNIWSVLFCRTKILCGIQSSGLVFVSEVGGPRGGISCWKLVWMEDGLEVSLSARRNHNTDRRPTRLSVHIKGSGSRSPTWSLQTGLVSVSLFL